MDAVTYYLPSPLDRPPVAGINPEEEGQGRETQARPEGAVLRPGLQDRRRRARRAVLSAHLLRHAQAAEPAVQPRQGQQGTAQQALPHHRRPDRPATSCPKRIAGDIVAIIGLKDSITGDTLCDPQHPILLERIQFAEAVVSRSIEPESSADKDKLTDVLNLLQKEDPTFTWKRRPGHRPDADERHGHAAPGNQAAPHGARFRLKVRVGKPRVSYRETLPQADHGRGRVRPPSGQRRAVRQGDRRVRADRGRQGRRVDQGRETPVQPRRRCRRCSWRRPSRAFADACSRASWASRSSTSRRRFSGGEMDGAGLQRDRLPGRRRRRGPQGDARQHRAAGAGDAPGGDGAGGVSRPGDRRPERPPGGDQRGAARAASCA